MEGHQALGLISLTCHLIKVILADHFCRTPAQKFRTERWDMGGFRDSLTKTRPHSGSADTRPDVAGQGKLLVVIY